VLCPLSYGGSRVWMLEIRGGDPLSAATLGRSQAPSIALGKHATQPATEDHSREHLVKRGRNERRRHDQRDEREAFPPPQEAPRPANVPSAAREAERPPGRDREDERDDRQEDKERDVHGGKFAVGIRAPNRTRTAEL
jgi:hypothetical protein